jgi:hypothetical protein
VEDCLWEVVVFTDEDGGKAYSVTIRAHTEEDAVRLGMREVRLALALLNPLVRVLGAKAIPKA